MNLANSNEMRNWSFEDHISLYASYNVQEAGQRARLFKHVESGSSASKRNAASPMRLAALAVVVTSILAFLFDRLLPYM